MTDSADAAGDADAARARSRCAPGLRYVYTGNVHDRAGGTTFCPACGTALIERDWYDIRGYHLTDEGACSVLRREDRRPVPEIRQAFRTAAHSGAAAGKKGVRAIYFFRALEPLDVMDKLL